MRGNETKIFDSSLNLPLSNGVRAMSSQARKPKVKWKEQINKDVLECKKKAQELFFFRESSLQQEWKEKRIY